MAKKEIIYQGLADFPVAIEDFSTNSPSYFLVTKLPTEFYAGTNILKFKGNSSLFKEDEPVYIEILDSNGAPIYYEVGLDLESAAQTAIVSVYINQDTAPGTGYIILCGVVNSDINGIPQDTSGINVRWIAPIPIDPSKRNDTDIIYDALPEVTIATSVGSYSSPDYNGSANRYSVIDTYNITYLNYNGTGVLVTSSLSPAGFSANSLGAEVYIDFLDIDSATPAIPNLVNSGVTLTATEITDGYIILSEPISAEIYNSNSRWQPSTAEIGSAAITYEGSGSLNVNSTENSYNVVSAYFTNLEPQLGTVSKIRSYYRSTGVGQYTLINETDISSLADEFGFTPASASVAFPLPTLQRNERIDFKFEFVNPAGYVSKQVIESLNNFFLGGNTYIGGDDNLLTGSLFVASATGTGVQITGKNNASMIKSLGYTGFYDALSGAGQSGFVLYSGSISPLLGETVTNSYSGVGLELVANSDSYFKYTTANGGLLDIRTEKFFIGTSNIFLSGSDGNLEILNKTATKTKFHLRPDGFVTASAFIAFTGSSDTSNYLMLDTSIGLVDGKNIGRILFSQGAPQILPNAAANSGISTVNFTVVSKPIAASLTVTAGRVYTENINAMTSSILWRAIPGTEDVSFYTLPFENQITVFGNVYIEKLKAGTGSLGLAGSSVTGACDPALTLALNFSVWEPTSGTYSSFGEAASGSGGAFLAGASGTVSFTNSGSSIGHELNQSGQYTFNYGSLFAVNNTTGSAAVRQMLPFKIIVPLPASASDKLVTLTSDYQLIKVGGGNRPHNDNFTFRAKIANMTAIIGRVLQSTATSGYGDFVAKSEAANALF